jgi:hypothetical protein
VHVTVVDGPYFFGCELVARQEQVHHIHVVCSLGRWEKEVVNFEGAVNPRQALLQEIQPPAQDVGQGIIYVS